MIVVLVEKDLDGLAVEVSRETVTFARSLCRARNPQANYCK